MTDFVVKDRITVVERVYHQRFGEQPVQMESRFGRELSDGEQPYIRTGVNCKATEKWGLIDSGWIRTAGMIIIVNEEGKFRQIKPTEEEREESNKKILEVAYLCSGVLASNNHRWFVLPGESMRACPSDIKSLGIRCQSGEAKFTICVYPS